MGHIIWIIVAVSGCLVGSIGGALTTGYFVIFKSLAHIASINDPEQWTKFFEGVIILMFTKGLVITGAIAGGFFGSIPGIIGMAMRNENN